jgi:hypothetical protein
MIRLLLILILTGYSALLAPARAQSPAHSQHHESTPTVEGAVHPELIPDPIAYRLYFLSVSTGPNPSDEDQKRQRLHLNKIGLQDLDREIVVLILKEFRTKHDSLADQLNQTSEAALARNQVPDTSGFLRQVDELVQLTRDTVKLRLTPQAMTQFDAFVQSEKKHMRIHGGTQ